MSGRLTADGRGRADTACVLAAWTFCVGFATSYAVLAVKQYHINMLLTSPMSEGEKRRMTDRWLMLYVGGHVAINAALCLAWTVMDEPRYARIVTATDQYGNRTQSYGTCSSKNITIYAAVVMTHHLALLIGGAYLSYRSLALNIHGAFSEGKQVRVAVVSALQILMLSIPVMMLSKRQDMTLFVRSMAILLQDAGTLLLILSPKALMLVQGVTDDGAQGAGMLVMTLKHLSEEKRTVLENLSIGDKTTKVPSSETSGIWTTSARITSRALARVAPA